MRCIRPDRPLTTDRHTAASGVGAVCSHPKTLAGSPWAGHRKVLRFQEHPLPPPQFHQVPVFQAPDQPSGTGSPARGWGALEQNRGGWGAAGAPRGSGPGASLRQAVCSGPRWGQNLLCVWRRGESDRVVDLAVLGGSTRPALQGCREGQAAQVVKVAEAWGADHSSRGSFLADKCMEEHK